MDRIEKFISKCKEPAKEKVYRPITSEEIETRKDIIEYLLSHKDVVNYTDRVFNKLEIILNDLIGGK